MHGKTEPDSFQSQLYKDMEKHPRMSPDRPTLTLDIEKKSKYCFKPELFTRQFENYIPSLKEMCIDSWTCDRVECIIMG